MIYQLDKLFENGLSIPQENVILTKEPVAAEIIPGEYSVRPYHLHRIAAGSYLVEGDGELRQVNIRGVVYVAGKMRGMPKRNFPAFDAATAALIADGWFVFNPADFDRQMGITENTPDDAVNQDLLRQCFDRDLASICRSDYIALIPGWEDSKGVHAEVVLGRVLGLRFIDLDAHAEVHPAAVCGVVGARLLGDFRALCNPLLN